MFASLEGLKERVGTIVTGEWRHPHRRPLGAFMSERSKAVQLRAFEEAMYLGHDPMGTEHLLLGILAQDTGEAAALLQINNVKFSEVRSATDLLNGSAPADPKKTKWFYTPEHTVALFAAEEHSRQLGCQLIEPEHLLYGVLQSEDTAAVRILRHLGANPQELLSAL